MYHKTVAVTLCLHSALLVATAVYSYTESSDFSNVFGAAEVPGCKGKCSVKDAAPVIECYHPLVGQGCDLNYCNHNEVRVSQCVVGNPGADDPKCDVTYDNTTWWRRQTIRKEACKDGGPDVGFAYGDACTLDGNGNATGETPCKTGACSTGPIQLILTTAGKPKCN